MDIGARIRAERKRKDLSQIVLAEKAGISVNSLRLYEGNKRQPGLSTVKRIADALGVAWHELIDLSRESMDYTKEDEYKKALEKALDYGGITREWLLAALSHLYGKAEEKSYCDSNMAFSYYLVAGDTPEQFILHASGVHAIIESIESLIPALVDKLKDKRQESEMIQEELKELDRIQKLVAGKEGIYLLEDCQEVGKPN